MNYDPKFLKMKKKFDDDAQKGMKLPGTLKGTSNENTEYAPLRNATSSSSSSTSKSVPLSSKSSSNNGFHTPKKASSIASAKKYGKTNRKYRY